MFDETPEEEAARELEASRIDSTLRFTTGCMAEAIDVINHKLGGGYAEDHPELIAAYMRTAAALYLNITATNAQYNSITHEF